MHPKFSLRLGYFSIKHGKRFQFSFKKGNISRTSCNVWDIIQLIPFVCAFYAFESSLFYSHCNCESKVMVIPFAMGTHQSDPLRRALFVVTHFKTLHFMANCFPSYLFPFIIDDTHIISPPFNYIMCI